MSYETAVKANICQCLPGVLETLKNEYRDALQAVDVNGPSVAEYAKGLFVECRSILRLLTARANIRVEGTSYTGTDASAVSMPNPGSTLELKSLDGTFTWCSATLGAQFTLCT